MHNISDRSLSNDSIHFTHNSREDNICFIRPMKYRVLHETRKTLSFTVFHFEISEYLSAWAWYTKQKTNCFFSLHILLLYSFSWYLFFHFEYFSSILLQLSTILFIMNKRNRNIQKRTEWMNNIWK